MLIRMPNYIVSQSRFRSGVIDNYKILLDISSKLIQMARLLRIGQKEDKYLELIIAKPRQSRLRKVKKN